MSDLALWRVRALALPPLVAHCTGCRSVRSFACAERFRVNAQGGRLDVWLLYRCSLCDATHKRRLHRRRPLADFAPGELGAYQSDDPLLVRAHAFERAQEALPYEVERPALARCGPLRARIVQPEPCGVRWDQLLARELGWSRARVPALWRRRAIAVAGLRAASARVVDGAELAIAASAWDDDRAAPERAARECLPSARGSV